MIRQKNYRAGETGEASERVRWYNRLRLVTRCRLEGGETLIHKAEYTGGFVRFDLTLRTWMF